MKAWLGALVVGALLMLAPQAQAIPFTYSYETAGGDVISGVLNGHFRPDITEIDGIPVDDSVEVDKVETSLFNGVLILTDPFVTAFGGISGITGFPLVTVSGAFMDFCVAVAPCSIAGFSIVAYPLLINDVSSSPEFGALGEVFDPARWSLRPIPAPVPEPATLTLLGLGLVGFGYARRRASSR